MGMVFFSVNSIQVCPVNGVGKNYNQQHFKLPAYLDML
jgi:hypothetical protein